MREPAIQSCETCQQIPCFDSCQLTMTWMSIIKLNTGYRLPHQLESLIFHIGYPSRMDRLPIFLCFLSGHPLLSGQSLKSPNNCRKEWGLKPLLSGHGHLQAISTRVLPLLSHLLSDHQALDERSLASFQVYAEGKYSPEQKVTTDCEPVIVLPSPVLFFKIR